MIDDYMMIESILGMVSDSLESGRYSGSVMASRIADAMRIIKIHKEHLQGQTGRSAYVEIHESLDEMTIPDNETYLTAYVAKIKVLLEPHAKHLKGNIK